MILPELFNSKPPERYNPMDRYRDFRKVFLHGDATEEQARRVLYLLLDHLGILRTPVRKQDSGIDPLATMHFVGRQDVARWLLNVLTQEPQDSPLKTAIRKQPND